MIGVLAIVATVALAVIISSGVAIAGQRADDATRARFSGALADGDLNLAVETATAHPELLSTDLDVVLDDEQSVDVDDAGYTLATVRLDAGTEYVIGSDTESGSAVLFGPDGDEAELLDGTFMVDEDGTHTLALVGDPGDTLTTTVGPVPLEEIDLVDPVDGEIAPGGVVDHAFDVFTGEDYYVETFTGTGLTVTFLDEAGQEIETYIDQDDDVRFQADSDGTVRARVEGESPSASGTYELDLARVATYFFYYGAEGDDAYLADDVEPGAVQPVVDVDRGALSLCIWIRGGVTVDLQFDPTAAGTSWDLFTYAEEGADVDDELESYADVQGSTVTLDTADLDQVQCLDLVPTDEEPEGTVDVTVDVTY